MTDPGMDTWSPDQYARFRNERSQPFFDLLALVEPRPGMTAVDLGCGTGELTRAMHRHLGAAATLGIDASEAMLARAATSAEPSLIFQKHDIATFAPEATFDLVFSNAALQWVPDHDRLIPRLLGLVRPGGQIAFQMPMNDDHVSHTTASDIAAEPPFAGSLGGYRRRDPPLPIERYVEMLDEAGFKRIDARIQIYLHRLTEPADVLEWVRGTMLTDYQRRLDPPLFARFVDAYRERLLERLPRRSPYLYTYRRILVCAREAHG